MPIPGLQPAGVKWRLLCACRILLQLALAPDEARQPAPRGQLEMRPQRAEPRHLVDIDRLADALDRHRPQGVQLEVALAELARGSLTAIEPAGASICSREPRFSVWPIGV
jgi:hypothetical protein